MMKKMSMIAMRSVRSTGRNYIAAMGPLVSQNMSRIPPTQNCFQVVSARGFASKRPPMVASDADEIHTLADALATEIAEEVAEDSVDQELEDIKAQIKKTFTIKDEVGHGVVNLHASIKGTQVHVTFDCQDEADTGFDMNELQMPSQASEDDEETPSIDFGINFTARIIHPNGDKIVLDCVASQSLQVLNMQHVPAGKEEEDGELYGGPVFDQLSESLQDSIYDHLEDHKIDDDLCFFILSYSRFKEQAEYINWLNSMLTTVEGQGQKK